MATIAPLENTRNLSLFKSNVTDEGLRCIANWSHLSVLYASARISTEGLGNARWLARINILDIDDTNVDDSLWPMLRSNPQLAKLGIGGTNIKEIHHVADHRHLRALCINSLPVTFDEFASFPCSASLTDLCANATPTNDDTCRSLSRMPNIVTLAAGDTTISDSACEHIAGLWRLEELIVNGTQISDYGISLLSRCRNCGFYASPIPT